MPDASSASDGDTLAGFRGGAGGVGASQFLDVGGVLGGELLAGRAGSLCDWANSCWRGEQRNGCVGGGTGGAGGWPLGLEKSPGYGPRRGFG